MIKATEAKKVTQEAREALKKKQTLEESRRLEKLFQARMKDADAAVRAAMKNGDDQCKLRWDHDEMPAGLRDRFESQVKEDGFNVEFHPNDEGDGWEIIINWKTL